MTPTQPIAQPDGTTTERIERCFLCGQPGQRLYNALSDRLSAMPGLWSILQCPNPACGLLWLNPRPTGAFLTEAYRAYHRRPADPTLSEASSGRWPRPLVWLYRAMLAVTGCARDIRRADRMFLHEVQPGRLLDVGCGAGSFLCAMRDRGWRVEGVEFDADAAATARERTGATIHRGTVGDAPLDEDRFDAITLQHVIEHLGDPESTLQRCGQLLKPGGRLVVRTPNARGLGHRIFASDWFQLDPPRHVYLYSPSTARTLMQRAGFSDVRVRTSSACADIVYMAGSEIRRTGAVRLAGRRPPLELMNGVLYQIAAGWISRLFPAWGEDVIVTGYRRGRAFAPPPSSTSEPKTF